MGLQVQEQHVRPDKDQLTTDTADLKMTKDALAEDTTAFEDTTQEILVCQTKVADFEVYTNKSLSEELEAFVKAKILISGRQTTRTTGQCCHRTEVWFRMPGRLIGESLDRLGNPTFRLGLQSQEQSQEQHIRLDEDQLTTDTTDLKMTEEETAAFEDTTQDCLAIQTKVVDFEIYTNKSLSEELEALAKAKAVISEKTGDAEYRDNRSLLSSHRGLVIEQIQIEHSIELAQLASLVLILRCTPRPLTTTILSRRSRV